MERIDKIISSALNISRNDARALIKSGRIALGGNVIKSIGEKLDERCTALTCDGKKIKYNKYVYIMMNKPKGVISASEGSGFKTVIDILPDEMKRRGLFPAGRLDKDTTGLMLITDDGDFAHRILSPKNHIPKTYAALLDKPFDDELKRQFEAGVELNDTVCQSAQITAFGGDRKKAVVTIRQGMYHQIKRMFAKYHIKVLELKRIKMGGLPLDDSLKEGGCRYITSDELDLIKLNK